MRFSPHLEKGFSSAPFVYSSMRFEKEKKKNLKSH